MKPLMIEKNSEPTHFVVPYCTGETATMYFFENRLMYGSVDQDNITLEQAKSIYESNDESVKGYTFDQLVAGLMYFECIADGKEMLQHTYQFDKLAIIPIEQAKALGKITDGLWDQCGGDSSTYAACETFGNVCESLADKVIDLHTSSEIEILEWDSVNKTNVYVKLKDAK